jgi:hypothetical protein
MRPRRRHQRPADALATPRLPHEQVADHEIALGAVGVIARVMQQIAEQRPIPLGDDSREGGVGAEAIATNALGRQAMGALLAQRLEISRELPRHPADRLGIADHGGTDGERRLGCHRWERPRIVKGLKLVIDDLGDCIGIKVYERIAEAGMSLGYDQSRRGRLSHVLVPFVGSMQETQSDKVAIAR